MNCFHDFCGFLCFRGVRISRKLSCCGGVIRKVKMARNRFGRICILGSGPSVLSMFCLCRPSYKASRLCNRWHLRRCMWSGQWFGSWDLNHVRKGQVLHRVRLHLKVPGWLSDLNALLTRKLPMFLSRFNEISGGALTKCWRSKRQLSKSFTVEIEPSSTRLI